MCRCWYTMGMCEVWYELQNAGAQGQHCVSQWIQDEGAHKLFQNLRARYISSANRAPTGETVFDRRIRMSFSSSILRMRNLSKSKELQSVPDVPSGDTFSFSLSQPAGWTFRAGCNGSTGTGGETNRFGFCLG